MNELDERSRRAERVERDGLLEVYAAAPGDAVYKLGLASERFGGMGAVACAALPVTDFNRVSAVGIDTPASADDLAAALAWFEALGAKGWGFQVSPLGQTPAVAAWFAERGFAPAGNGWAKFQLSTPVPEPAKAEADGIAVRLVDAASADDFGRVMQSGFGTPPATSGWFASLGRMPNWRAYLAFAGDEPAGVGSLFIKDGAAWFNSDTTFPAFRRRGIHSALIARRVADAVSAGATLLTGETGYPSEGDEKSFPSFRNYRRAGFELAYVRPNFKRG